MMMERKPALDIRKGPDTMRSWKKNNLKDRVLNTILALTNYNLNMPLFSLFKFVVTGITGLV